MATAIFMLLGLVVGAALGIVLPVGFSMFMAWLDNFEPGAGAPTAFAILLPFTTIAGAVVGTMFGYLRGSTGTWQRVFSPPKKKDFWTKLWEPSPLNETVVQELAFLARGPADHDVVSQQAQLLEAAYKQYDEFVWSRATILQLVVFSILLPLLAPFGIALAVAHVAKRISLSRRIEAAKSLWLEQPPRH